MAQPGTGGTSTTVVLSANIQPGSFIRPDGTVSSFSEPDSAIAAINQAIKDDQNFNQPAPAGGPMWGWLRSGTLYIPNRGVVRVLAGDVVMVDPVTGWPILVSSRALAGGSFVSTAT